jgi:hypothetical protein
LILSDRVAGLSLGGSFAIESKERDFLISDSCAGAELVEGSLMIGGGMFATIGAGIGATIGAGIVDTIGGGSATGGRISVTGGGRSGNGLASDLLEGLVALGDLIKCELRSKWNEILLEITIVTLILYWMDILPLMEGYPSNTILTSQRKKDLNAYKKVRTLKICDQV